MENIEVLILVGGKGARLQSVVSDVPKPMAPIGDRPFLDYLIENLENQGLCNISLLSGYKAELIADHFKAKKNVKVIVEDKPLGTGGAIINALKEVEGERILVLNGDTFFHGAHTPLLTTYHKDRFLMGLTLVEDVSRYGEVFLNESNQVEKMKEKQESSSSGLINLGMYLFNKEVLSSFSTLEKSSLETEILPKLIASGHVFGQALKGDFIDIGIPSDYQKSQELIPRWL